MHTLELSELSQTLGPCLMQPCLFVESPHPPVQKVQTLGDSQCDDCGNPEHDLVPKSFVSSVLPLRVLGFLGDPGSLVPHPDEPGQPR